ncbi:MAG: hypothetical protein NUV78_02700 [Candidatus Zambryskibacteria bacterium]|nr:hypothetical protein [Candidatus Zambryskibacteria bacterium]
MARSKVKPLKSARLKEISGLDGNSTGILETRSGAEVFNYGPVESMRTVKGSVLFSQCWIWLVDKGKEIPYALVYGYQASDRYTKRSGAEAVKVRPLRKNEQMRHYSALRRKLRGPLNFY